jgi:hypothetical protein
MKITSIFFSVIFFFLLSCNESGTNPEKNLPGFSFYSGKCGRDLLELFGARDSSFEYSFQNDLLIDFIASGNCCPDSDRFIVSSDILSDTIYITVEDTAAHLCRCMCNYHIYSKFSNLQENHYTVLCTLQGSDAFLYLKDVYRRNGSEKINF